jgi:putative SOS response-associated peptidase YedK
VCGRFTSSQRLEAIGERFEVVVPEMYAHRFNLAPQQRALIVRERDVEREAVMAKWGLLPHWAKDAKIAFKMTNARAETLSEKPAYRGLLGWYRCLIPADGFHEWEIDARGSAGRAAHAGARLLRLWPPDDWRRRARSSGQGHHQRPRSSREETARRDRSARLAASGRRIGLLDSL